MFVQAFGGLKCKTLIGEPPPCKGALPACLWKAYMDTSYAISPTVLGNLAVHSSQSAFADAVRVTGNLYLLLPPALYYLLVNLPAGPCLVYQKMIGNSSISKMTGEEDGSAFLWPWLAKLWWKAAEGPHSFRNGLTQVWALLCA